MENIFDVLARDFQAHPVLMVAIIAGGLAIGAMLNN